MPTYKTAESVTPKHPDKLCDQISDAILDAHLREDPKARVAVDVAGGRDQVFVTGEVTSKATRVDVPVIVKRIAGNAATSIVNIAKQSPEISQGVDIGGAGDQGVMVGYACNETPEYLPLEYVLARRLCQYLYERWPHDGKTQVTLKNGEITSIVASFQHAPKRDLVAQILVWVKHEPLVKARQNLIEVFANPAGDWQIGGFEADSGLTGRKLVVDNYGPRIPIGGGAYSGKDPSKVDRSAAYMARRIAVDYLKARAAKEVYVYLAYAIGHDQPLEASVVIDGTQETVMGYDLTPRGIVACLNLEAPQYEQLAQWGHYGHAGLAWETGK